MAWHQRSDDHGEALIVIGLGVLLVLGIGTMSTLIWLTSDLVHQVHRIDADHRQVIEQSVSTLQRCTEQLQVAP